MSLVICMPENYVAERLYICRVIFDEFFGIKYRMKFMNCNDIQITMQDDMRDKKLYLEDEFFNKPDAFWLTENNYPKQPLNIWDLSKTALLPLVVSPLLPVIYGSDPSCPYFFRTSEDNIYLGLDILGSAFFMLTRYEEVIKHDRDLHNRFPASASLAYQEGFLERPIINEYIDILWWCLKNLWPGLKRRKRSFKMILSHDVDAPFLYALLPITKNFSSCADDILTRKNLSLAINRFYNWFMYKKRAIEKDPYYLFDLIMEISEKYYLKSTFYFQTHKSSSHDGYYSIQHPQIKYLLQNIYNRGHKIGLHPSYHSFHDSKQIKKEFKKLLETCGNLGIDQDEWGARQHYLRWEVPYTWQSYEDAGLHYDTSLSYADHAGFRCGICYDFPVFNLLTRKELGLIEKPLIAMEASLLNKKYMNMTHGEAGEKLKKFADYCKQYDGNFSLLWHNSWLTQQKYIEIYSDVIEYSIMKND